MNRPSTTPPRLPSPSPPPSSSPTTSAMPSETEKGFGLETNIATEKEGAQHEFIDEKQTREVDPSLADPQADERPDIEDEATTAQTYTYPDGGLRAWLVLTGAFLTMTCGFGLMAGVGAFQSYYREALPQYSSSEIAWIASLQSFMTFMPAIFTGPFFDKWGPRVLTTVGTVSLVLGFLFLSFSTKYYQLFLCHATLIPWGCNLMFVCSVAVIPHWFLKRRGLAFGIASCGSSVGSVIWPLVLATLPQKIGFAWSCRVLMLIGGVFGGASIFLMKARLPPKPKGSLFALSAFKNVEYSLVVFNFFTFAFGNMAFQVYIGTFGNVIGLGHMANYLLIISNAASTFGRFGSGVLADKIGVLNTVLIGNAAEALLLWCWLACTTLGQIIPIAVLCGIAMGAFISQQGAFANTTTKDPRIQGTMLGQALFVQSLALLACGPSVGAVFGSVVTLKTFRDGIYLIATMMTLALIAVIFARFKANPRPWVKA